MKMHKGGPLLLKLPDEIISQVFEYVDVSYLSQMCSILHSCCLKRTSVVVESNLMMNERYVELMTRSAFPCLYQFTAAIKPGTKTSNGLVGVSHDELGLIQFVHSMYKSMSLHRLDKDIKSAVTEFGQLLSTILNYEKKRITLNHLILFMKQLYPFAMIVGKDIPLQVESALSGDVISNLHSFTNYLLDPNAKKIRMSTYEWVADTHRSVNILKFSQTVIGAAYGTQKTIRLQLNNDILNLTADDCISPVILGVSDAFFHSNCQIRSILLYCALDNSFTDGTVLIPHLQINIDYLLDTLVQNKHLNLTKFALRMPYLITLKEKQLQTSITIAVLESLAHQPTLKFEEIEICGMIISNSEIASHKSNGLMVLSTAKRVSLLHPAFAEDPLSKSNKTPKSIARSTQKKSAFPQSAFSRTRRKNGFEIFDKSTTTMELQNDLCSYVLNRWFVNSRSILQSKVERIELFDITHSKLVNIISNTSSLKKMKIYFDNSWQYVETEKISELRRAMTNNETITHVSIDTKHGNFNTSVFQMLPATPHQSPDDPLKKNHSDTLCIDDCVGFSFFKCIASLPCLEDVSIEIPFSKTLGLFNPQILSSMFETLQFKDQRIKRLKIRETVQVMNACNTKFADHLLTVLMSYMDEIVKKRIIFKVYSTTLFQLICESFASRRETEQIWQYHLIYFRARHVAANDYTFSFILKYARNTDDKKARRKQSQQQQQQQQQQRSPSFPLLELVFCCKDISLADLLVDEEVESVLMNVGMLTKCVLNTDLIKKHLKILNISSAVKLNRIMINTLIRERLTNTGT